MNNNQEEIFIESNILEDCPEDKHTERDIIKKLISSEEMKVGSNWYLINKKWLNCWKEYVEYDNSTSFLYVTKPSEINNVELFDRNLPSRQLKKQLYFEIDYTVFSPPVWNRLFKWFVLFIIYPTSFTFFSI